MIRLLHCARRFEFREFKFQEVEVAKNTETTLFQEKPIDPVAQNITIVDDTVTTTVTTTKEELQPIEEYNDEKPKTNEGFLAKINKFISKYIGETDDE